MKKTILFLLAFFLIQTAYSQNGGYALIFDGTDDYVSVPDHSSLDFTEFTAEMWIYKTNSGDIKLIGQAYPNSAGKGWSLGITSDNTVFAEAIHNSGNKEWTQINNGTIPTNEWTHVAMTWKRSDKLILYINGEKIEEKASDAWDIATTSLLIVGKAPWYNINENHFGGYMDEIRLWNTVRTEAEIKANMYKELAGTETNLVAYYKMSNGSGTTLTDNQTSGTNNGAISGATWKASGAFAGSRQALDFDGTNDYVDFEYGKPPYNNSTLTLEAWIKTTSNATEREIMSWDTPNAIELRVNEGKLQFGINATGWQAITGSTNVNTGNWTHVAAVKNGSNITLYVNGIIDASGSINQNPSGPHFQIGHLYGDNSTRYWFPGQIDEVRIWHSVRTGAEIRENMMKTLAGNETGLVAYYRFDQYDGTTLYDMTGNGYNGTLTNMDAATDWVSSSAFNTWIGSESTDWSTAANWSSGVPAAGNSVGIYKWTLDNVTTYDAALSGSPELNSILFSSTATPTVSTGFTANGTIVLEKDINFGSNNITLGTSGYLSEGNYRFYGSTGTITTTRNLSNIDRQNVGGLGAKITTTANMGSTTITRGHSAHQNSILRYYNIVPTNNTDLSATLVFNYHDDELNGVTEANLGLFKSSDGTNWTGMLGTLDSDNNTITLTGIGGFSLWTAGDKNSPLPVELTSFTASTVENKVVLNWQTATEVNNYGFEIQRSVVSGQRSEETWEKVGFVDGNGNSNSVKEYSFVDASIPLSASSISYRLKQIDNDGGFSYSDEIIVETLHVTSLPTEYTLEQNYPNPFNPSTTIKFGLPTDSKVVLEVYNIIGEKVKTLVNKSISAGYHEVEFTGTALPSGIYIYKLATEGFTSTKKFVLMK